MPNKIQEVRKLEKRRIILFIVQFSLLAGLVFTELVYPNLISSKSFRLIHSMVFLLTSLLLISIVRMVVVFLYVKKKRRHITYRDNFILGINQIASILSFLALIVGFFIFFKIEYKDLITSLSIFAVALTLIFKDYISNTINGMVVMFSNQLSLHEYVRIGEHYGKIENVTLKNVILKNDNGDLVYIPNNTIFHSEILNMSKRREEKIWVEFDLLISRLESPEYIEAILISAMEKFNHLVKQGSMGLKVLKVAADTIFFKFEFTMVRKNPEMEKEIQSHINQKIVSLVHKPAYDSKNLKISS